MPLAKIKKRNMQQQQKSSSSQQKGNKAKVVANNVIMERECTFGGTATSSITSNRDGTYE